MEELRLALLIDAENTSVKYVDAIISELKKYGVITYQRMYGDFTNSGLSGWNKMALKHAIVPIQQQRYSTSKNAADIMLVIDAMDILYQDKIDGFCIVSSDSDFTRLVNRLKEEGKIVIGMGKSDASTTFIAACSEYKFLDKITDEEIQGEESGKTNLTSITPISAIKASINNMIQQSENNGEYAELGNTKSTLQRLYPDFDERNYGYNSMLKFITEATRFEILQKGYTIYIVRNKKGMEESIENMVRKFIKEKAKKTVELAALGNQLHEKFPEFKYKDYGYARLSKYVSSIDDICLNSKNIVTVRNHT